MDKIVALCTDSEAFLQNRIFDANWAVKFPGAEVMPELAKLLGNNNYKIVTGDIALSNVKAGNWNPKEILIIMDADSYYGLELLNLGSIPKILSCFESPIFAWPFYDKLKKLGPKFEHRILFKGSFENFDKANGQNHPVYFPIFHIGKLLQPRPWNKRKQVVLVAGNKHWKKSAHFSLSLKPKKYIKWWRKYKTEKNSPTLKATINNELQTKRLEMIEFFAGQNHLDIFGQGWQKISKLPRIWQKKLKTILTELNPQPCENKTETISGYKFAICVENVSYIGYVTEKIIDCFVAGVIPIYFGAPDINDFVPQEAFINAANFDNLYNLNKYMESITEEKADKMIKAGQDFLKSPAGEKYSFENSAEFLLKLLINTNGIYNEKNN